MNPLFTIGFAVVGLLTAIRQLYKYNRFVDDINRRDREWLVQFKKDIRASDARFEQRMRELDI